MKPSYELFCFMGALTVLLCILVPTVHSARSTQEEDNYGSSTPYVGSSPPKHSSSPACSCSTPSTGSGPAYHYTPPTPQNTPPSYKGHHNTPSEPHKSPPSHAGAGGNPPHTTPSTPPVPTVPSPPAAYEPDVPPFQPGTCSYWSSHPHKIIEVIGYFGKIGDFFGAGCLFAFGGKNPTLHDAVTNTDLGGISALLREGTAALLNSIACKSFPLTQKQVRIAFVGALASESAAAVQADSFRMANEGRYKS